MFFLKSGKRTFLITASHLYKADEWEALRKIVLSDMQGQVKGECKGKPLHVGKYTEGSDLEKAFLPDFKEDLIIHEVSENLPFIPLKLAEQLPVKGETVWVVGCESATNQGQQLYPCKYLNTTEKMLMFKPVTSFMPADFSGAPVINQAGEVIGTLNGGNPNFYMGTPLSAIKLHGKSKAIEFE